MRYFYYLLFLFLISCKKEISNEIVQQQTTIVDTIKTTNSINFEGYKVDQAALTKYGVEYWYRMTPVMTDLVNQTFQTPNLNLPNCYACQKNFINAGWVTDVCGDFNNDGFIDVFTAGASPGVDFSFLIWNKTTKRFDKTNLLNDKTITSLPNAKVTPVYLNGDNYLDFLISPGDDGPTIPMSLVVSDGKGKYDVIKIPFEKITLPNGQLLSDGYDATCGDLNGDGIPDLFIYMRGKTLIYYGKRDAPYFNSHFDSFFWGNEAISDNGFGEKCADCGGDLLEATIHDVNGDGLNDILMTAPEEFWQGSNGRTHQKILINQGKGRFNESGVINLPFYDANLVFSGKDMLLTDINGDGKNDIVEIMGKLALQPNGSYNSPLDGSLIDIVVYIQQNDGSFKLDKTWFQFNSNYPTRTMTDSPVRLLYADFNGDGIKDIGYMNNQSGGEYGDYNSSSGLGNVMKLKTVFIRQGNQFVETPFYQFDTYANGLIPILFARFH